MQTAKGKNTQQVLWLAPFVLVLAVLLFGVHPLLAQQGGGAVVVVPASDDDGVVVGMTETVSNQPPVVNNPGQQVNDEGDVIQGLTITAYDPDGGRLTFSAANLPGGLTMNSANGVITGGIAADASANSPYAVTVTVTDDGTPPQSATLSFDWVVNPVTTEYEPNSLRVSGLETAPVLPKFSWNHRDMTDPNARSVPGEWYGLTLYRQMLDANTGQLVEMVEIPQTWYPTEQICENFTCTVTPEHELFFEGTYRWEVTSYRDGTDLLTSDSTFALDMQTPAAINDLQVDVSEGVPRLRWTEDPLAGWYNVYISVADQPTNVAYQSVWFRKSEDICSGGVCEVVPPNIYLRNGAYEVYVSRWGPGGYAVGGLLSGFSQSTRFTLNFNAPQPLTNVSFAEVQSGSPIFSWDAADGASWYNIWVGRFEEGRWNQNFAQWIPATDICKDGVCQFETDSIVLPNGGYSVFFDAIGPGGRYNAYQLTGEIAVTSPMPGVVEPMMPGMGVTDDIFQTFVWKAADHAEWYHLTIHKDGAVHHDAWYSKDQLDCMDDGICQVRLDNVYFLPATYSWSVTPYSPAGLGVQSATLTFTID